MLFSKSFVKKTKKGSVIKIVKEHYLRDDLYCGLLNCAHCPPHPTTLAEPLLFQGTPHYMIPDTNVLYHQVVFI
jgi:exosome complex exonuclease DIS3/RRP44